MELPTLVPAAEYIRMSTDEQPTSIPVQQEEIRRYATLNGYQVVATYSDPGRSGVAIRHRPGLQQLLRDAVGGQASFRAILVYDVSRWGRFQDTDESAHYEFLCRSAGVPVHYCAEQFQNNGALANDIVKALKRMMAAEYSRELAKKVASGMRYLVTQGFWLGSTPGYGLRRMLISSDGKRRQLLEPHERKNLRSDHVILVPGPQHEVDCVRTIFFLASKKRRSPAQIARELNRRQITYLGGAKWNKLNVYAILKNEKYVGTNVWGKKTKPFGKFTRVQPRDTWTVKNDAFVPLVDATQFLRVQKLMQTRNNKLRKPDDYFLNEMRRVLAREGRLSQKLLKARGVFDHRCYVRRFGSMLRAYELIGYRPGSNAFRSMLGWRKLQQLREELLKKLEDLFPKRVRIIHRSRQSYRCGLELDNGTQIAVHICRPLTQTLDGPRWMLMGNRFEDDLVSLICLSDESLSGYSGFYLVPEIGSVLKRCKVLRDGHPLLATGTRLESLSEFYEIAKRLSEGWRPDSDLTVVGDAIFRERASSLSIAGKEIRLSRIQAKFVKMLLRNPGLVIRSEMLCQCSPNPTEFFPRAHISALRSKLGPKLRKRIVTVPNEGYLYRAD